MWSLIKHRQCFPLLALHFLRSSMKCLLVCAELFMKIHYTEGDAKKHKTWTRTACVGKINSERSGNFMTSFASRFEDESRFAFSSAIYANLHAHYGFNSHFCNSLIYALSLTFIGSEERRRKFTTKRSEMMEAIPPCTTLSLRFYGTIKSHKSCDMFPPSLVIPSLSTYQPTELELLMQVYRK